MRNFVLVLLFALVAASVVVGKYNFLCKIQLRLFTWMPYTLNLLRLLWECRIHFRDNIYAPGATCVEIEPGN